MKLSARDIKSFIAAPAERSKSALLYGPDQGLVYERSLHIRNNALGKDHDPLNVIELSGEQVKADPALLMDELTTLSLMGGDRLVIVREAADAMTKTLQQALADTNKLTAYLVVMAGDLTPRSSLRKLFETENHLAALPCYHDDARSLAEVIRNTLHSANLRTDTDAIQYLCAQLGNDRGITQSELEKIIVYMGGEQQVTLEIVQMLVEDSSELALDDLSRAVAGGNIKEIHSAFARHMQEGISPVSLIRAVMRYFLKLQQAVAWLDSGSSAEEAAKKTRTFFKYIPAFKLHLKRWNAGLLHQAQAMLIQAERDIKYGSPIPELITERSFLRISRLAH